MTEMSQETQLYNDVAQVKLFPPVTPTRTREEIVYVEVVNRYDEDGCLTLLDREGNTITVYAPYDGQCVALTVKKKQCKNCFTDAILQWGRNAVWDDDDIACQMVQQRRCLVHLITP